MSWARVLTLSLVLCLSHLLTVPESTFGFPYCWGDTTSVTSDGHRKKAAQALFDTQGKLHVFWYDHAETALCHTWRNTDGSWDDIEVVTHTGDSTLGAAVDSSDNLHVVWTNTTALGPLGETSNLFYKKRTGSSWGDSVCITPMYNVVGDVDTLHDEGFENGVPPENWAWESDKTWGCKKTKDISVPPDTCWGVWEDGGWALAYGDSHCALGRRLYGCKTTCGRLGCAAYLAMPPFIISGGES